MAVSESVTGNEILEAARTLAPQIRAAAQEIEQGRRLPLSLVQAMKDAGIFRMPMPRAWGGPEVDPLTQIRIVEELSAADPSVGWCAMIGSDGGYFTAFLEDGVGRNLPEHRLADYLKHCALGRVGTFDEVARLAAFMVSGVNGYMSGETVIADGGV